MLVSSVKLKSAFAISKWWWYCFFIYYICCNEMHRRWCVFMQHACSSRGAEPHVGFKDRRTLKNPRTTCVVQTCVRHLLSLFIVFSQSVARGTTVTQAAVWFCWRREWDVCLETTQAKTKRHHKKKFWVLYQLPVFRCRAAAVESKQFLCGPLAFSRHLVAGFGSAPDRRWMTFISKHKPYEWT